MFLGDAAACNHTDPFFVLVFGPIAYWVLARSASQSFGAGIEAVSQLPTAYLMLTIVIAASAEELLYRGYAITRLSDLAGSYLLASIVSVVAFGLAHVPMWGWPPAATTIVSGGILTVVYLWRQDSALILAHIATDLYGIVLAPHLARALANWPMLCRGLGVNYLSPDRRARRVSRWRPMQ